MRFLKIGQIVNVHGIKGEVKVYPYTDDIVNLSKKKYVYLDESIESKININLCRIQKNMLLVKFEKIDTVEEAEKLRNKYIYVLKEELDSLEEDNYYVDDLISMQVVDIKNNKAIGTITYVFNTGANDIYEVLLEDGKKAYLPAIKQVVKKVDVDENKMYVELMKGLI